MKQFIASLNGVVYANNTASGGVDTFTNLSTINHTTTGLLAGSFAVIGGHTATYDMGGILATGTGISTLLTANVENFRIAVGRSANGAYLTNPIDISTLNIESAIYAAGTPRQATFVIPATGTLADIDIGTEYTIVIDDLNKNSHDSTRRHKYTHVLTAANVIAAWTETDLAAALSDLITADITSGRLNFLTSAIDAGATITFIGVVGLSFHVFGQGELTFTELTTTVEATASVGTYADMLALEKEASTERGNNSPNYLTDEFYSSPSMLVAGVNYDVIKLTWKTPDSDQLAIKTQNPYQTLTIACPTGGVYATLLNILTT
jgi:hypothetical protein